MDQAGKDRVATARDVRVGHRAVKVVARRAVPVAKDAVARVAVARDVAARVVVARRIDLDAAVARRVEVARPTRGRRGRVWAADRSRAVRRSANC